MHFEHAFGGLDHAAGNQLVRDQKTSREPVEKQELRVELCVKYEANNDAVDCQELDFHPHSAEQQPEHTEQLDPQTKAKLQCKTIIMKACTSTDMLCKFDSIRQHRQTGTKTCTKPQIRLDFSEIEAKKPNTK
jgi:hypothetical protein